MTSSNKRINYTVADLKIKLIEIETIFEIKKFRIKNKTTKK